MWNYEKRLQFPVKITKTNPKIASQIISQYGGPDGEMSASMRYLAQRYTMPVKRGWRTFDRHRYRRIKPHGDDLCHGLSADQKSDTGAGQSWWV